MTELQAPGAEYGVFADPPDEQGQQDDLLGASWTPAQSEEYDETSPVSLCEVLDRVLTKGVVVSGDVVISVADVDLLYLRVQVLLCSADKAEEIGIWKKGHSSLARR
jgi:hypothetical protein